MALTHDDILVTIKMINKKKTLAQAIVVFRNEITTKGWKIIESSFLHPQLQENIDIKPPSVFCYGRWLDLVFVENKDDFYFIQEKIYDAYKKEQAKSTNSNYAIDISDEIPL
jgi:hypothetical protein